MNSINSLSTTPQVLEPIAPGTEVAIRTSRDAIVAPAPVIAPHDLRYTDTSTATPSERLDYTAIVDAVLRAHEALTSPTPRSSTEHGRLSAVVPDTFYAVDLNAIQAAVLAAQNNGGQADDKNQVYVDANGDVMLGGDVQDVSRASAVVGDTFYARDLAEETRTVQTKMPAAVKVSDGTHEGYAYSITNRFGDKYDLFIYYSPAHAVYRVALVSPRLGGQLDVHGGHLYSDGTLCLTERFGSGYPSMEQTYAKSALWTLGASLFRRGYGFQFNPGQDGGSRA